VVGRGQPANDLLDERDRLISRLSDKVQLTRIDASDGTTSVFMAGGQRLVLGSTAAELSVVQDPADSRRSAVALKEGALTRILPESEMGGGSIAGLLRFQNQDLAAGRNLVGQLAAAIGGALNTQQMRGVNLQSPLGTVPSSALFGIGAPEAQANTSNARDGFGNLLAGVNLTVTDPAALQASDYDLREDPALPGAWQLTRLSDGKITSVVDGDVVDGVQINFTGAPQPGDKFLLQPVARAANTMSVLLSNPLDLAAASPLVASTSPANIGTANVASLTITAGPLPVPGASVQVDFVSDTGDYTWQMLDAGNNVLAVGSGVWTAGQSIPPAGTDINGFSLMINGVPRTGDIITIEPTPASALSTNNGNALALTALRMLPSRAATPPPISGRWPFLKWACACRAAKPLRTSPPPWLSRPS
jgi:flagellar hook-associated protein 1 FlgK